MPTPPSLTPEQRAAAAAKAVRARAVRARLRRDLTAGRLSLAEAFALATDDDEAGGAVAAMRVSHLLESLPGVGERRTDKVMTALAIPVGRRVRGLGSGQRADLLARLGAPGRLPGVLSPARLTVLSGPSGVGKGTLVREIRGSELDIWISVSCTTRRPRPGETDGVEYFFRTEPEFEALVAAGDMLEWARFAGNLYGTPREPVQERLAAGVPVLLEIDLQGARQVRAAMPEARLVFLAPPDVDELDRRLTGRGTEDEQTLAARRALAEVELAAAREFDTVVVNDDIGRAAAELVRLVSSA